MHDFDTKSSGFYVSVEKNFVYLTAEKFEKYQKLAKSTESQEKSTKKCDKTTRKLCRKSRKKYADKYSCCFDDN